MHINRSRVWNHIIFVLLLLALKPASAQIAINSPYTRYGLGWMVDNRFETRMMAMGGLRYGMQHPHFINPANPASYAAFDSTTFIFQGGVFGVSTQLRNDLTSGNSNYMSMSHLLFAFSVTKWWGTSFGVLPYSYVGYDIVVESELEDLGLSRSIFRGSGGFNRVYWGNSFKIYKGLSAGFNLSYLFGEINRVRALGFPNNQYIRNTRVNTTFTAKDFIVDFGLQYKARIKDKYYFTSGVVYSPEIKVNSEGNSLATAYYGDLNSVLARRDTIWVYPDVDGDFTVPTKMGIGFSFEQPGKWMAGVDFRWQNWDKYQAFGLQDSVQNSWMFAVGGEVIPNNRSIRSYWENVSYRFGFRYGQTYYHIENTDIREFGISFGMGLPIRRSYTSINLALEAGKMGTTVNGLIQENFIRFTIGVNIFERWFIKRRYY